MFIIRADTALLPDGWQNNVYVHINSLGKIDRVTTSLESGKPDTHVSHL
ncbi:MAG: formimidoylglutamate deiminase, partial [Candidatus Puniceispirillaceae bacterium]